VHHVVSAAERRDHVGSEGFGDREFFGGDLVELLSLHAEVGVAKSGLSSANRSARKSTQAR
jgi:hypothetical protein